MAAGNEQTLVEAIKYDVRVMHETWMEFVFPRQRDAADTVLGKWEPEETGESKAMSWIDRAKDRLS